jgi:hypothetical protein
MNRLRRAEVQEVINSLNPKKSSGYDLINGIWRGKRLIGR